MVSSEQPGTGIQRGFERGMHRARTVDLQPHPDATKTILSCLVPVALGVTAAVASGLTKSEKVATTAWVAVAVVGTASVIAGAAATRSRHVEVTADRNRSRDRFRPTE